MERLILFEHPCRLATVSVGYADGYARSLSNKGWVLIHGQRHRLSEECAWIR